MARQLDVGRLRDLAAAGWGVDLHAHSLHSDGAWTPAELVRDAHLQGVRVAALTDHDTVAGQAEMLDAGAAAGMAIVTGIEVTTRVGEHSYHLLCYGLDPAAEAWSVVRANRHDRIDQFYDSLFAQLRQHGYAVRDADVRGPDGRYVKGPIGRGLVGGGFAADGTAAWTLVRSLNLAFPVDLIARRRSSSSAS